MAESVLRETVESLGAASATLFVAEGGGLRSFCASPPSQRTDAATENAAEWSSATVNPLGLPGTGPHRARRVRASPAPSEALGRRRRGVTCPCAARPASPASSPSRRARREALQRCRRPAAGVARQPRRRLPRASAPARRGHPGGGRCARPTASSRACSPPSPTSSRPRSPRLTATVSNLLESDVAWDERSVREELRAIVADVTRLNNSIGALLDLSRLEAHAWEPHREPYDLSDVVAASLDTLPAHQRSRVAVQLPDDLPRSDLDFVQWARVFQNLFENALLYAGEESRHPRRRAGRHAGSAPLGRGRRAGHPCRRTRGRVREVLPGPAASGAQAPVGHRLGPGHHARDRARPRRHDPRRGRADRTAHAS